LAKEIVDSLAWPVAVDGQQIRTGTSIGIALAPTDGASPQELLKNADVALYRAKTEGRGRWAFFAAALDTEAERRRLLDLDLRRALQTGGESEVLKFAADVSFPWP
jgi:predicted signal transduction protein with EAL and GGDEF domain